MSKKHKNSVVTYIGGGATVGVKCHTGNIAVMVSSKKGGGSLYCGGWSRGAYSDDLAVIDLTGTEPIDVSNPMRSLNDSADQWFGKAIGTAAKGRELPWLAFKIKDFGVPQVERETWVELSRAISNLMDAGHSVIMACNGGHGRTGTAASIICYLMNSDIGDPVTYLRKVYCEDAVETRDQHLYVHKMLNLPEPEKVEYKHDPKAYNYGSWTGGYGGVVSQGSYQPGYVWDSTLRKWTPPQPKPTEQPSPPLEGGDSPKKDGWWMDSLVAELEASSINYDVVQVDTRMPTGLSRFLEHIEVAILTKTGLAYYEVTGYDELSKTVKLEDVTTGETRQVGVTFLASKYEVDKVYGQP